MVVIGAGVMGSATARSLAERGVDTLLLEQFDLGHARGSSHGPTRIFRLSYPIADYTRLAQQALQSWRALEAAAGERLLVTTGGLDVGPQARDCRASLEQAGEPFEWLSADEATERFPAISFADDGDILYQPDAGVCLADRTVAALVRVARQHGAVVRDGTKVERVEPTDDGVRVRTPSGEISARVAVLTAGAWAPQLLDAAGMPSPTLTPILQRIAYFAAPDDLPTFIDWSGPELSWYALPSAGEAPGMKVGQHVGGVAVDPDEGPFEVDQELIAMLAEYVRRRFPGADPKAVHTETCLYTMTPDEDFIIDRVGPVVIGSPCSGHGFKFAPLIGELLAGLATGARTNIPDPRFTLTRSALRVRAR